MNKIWIWPLLLLLGFVGYAVFPQALSTAASIDKVKAEGMEDKLSVRPEEGSLPVAGSPVSNNDYQLKMEDASSEARDEEPSNYIKNEYAQAGISAQPELDQQIDKWIASLYDQPGFDTWKGASREVLPLGPGLHGWVVLLNQGDRQVGYLIVNAAEDGGYQLTEYGTGSKPLYSMQTLYQGLVQSGIIDSSVSYVDFAADLTIRKEACYSNGLQALWKVTIDDKLHYFDAKSGEELPDLSEWLSSRPSAETIFQREPAKPKEKVQSLEMPEFDPFEHAYWLTGKPVEDLNAENAFFKLSSMNQVTYTARLFAGKVYNPYAVSGVHLWNDGSLYAALDQDGPRYFMFEQLQQTGQWFQQPQE
nr:hypothetical protein [Aneurinibacillus sp. XH2]